MAGVPTGKCYQQVSPKVRSGSPSGRVARAESSLERAANQLRLLTIEFMTKKLQYGCWFAVGVIVLLTTTMAHGQSLSISATNSLPTFPLNADPTPASPLTVQANWNGWAFGQLTVNVCVSMTAAMTGTGSNTDTIPATAVQVNGTSIVSGSTNCGFPGASLVGTKTHSCFFFCGGFPDQYTINVRLAGYSPSLLPDTYTGTINLIAQTQ